MTSNIRISKAIFKRVRYSLAFLMFGSAFMTYYGLGYSNAPQIIKLVFSVSVWVSLILFPFELLHKSDLDKRCLALLKVIFVLVFISVLRGICSETSGISSNKWFTLFANDQFFLMLLIPMFMLIGTIPQAISILKRYFYIYILLCFWGVFIGENILAKSLFIGIVLLPYVPQKYCNLIYITMLQAIIMAFFQDDTSRTMILLLGLSLISYLLVYIYEIKSLLKWYAMLLIFIPAIYSIILLFVPDFSIIEIIMDYLSVYSANDSMTTDTRTFLFREMSADLSYHNAWILGKGAYSYYYSAFFEETGSDSAYRIASEVTFLTFLLRSGFSYVILYYALISLTVWKALTKAKSKFIRMCALMGGNWCFISFISYLNGFNFIYASFFILLGCCASEKWLRKTDNEIKLMFLS